MRGISARAIALRPLILMKGCFMRMNRGRKIILLSDEPELKLFRIKMGETQILRVILTQIKCNIYDKIKGKI